MLLLSRYILRRAGELAAGQEVDPDLAWLLTPEGSDFLINQQWTLKVVSISGSSSKFHTGCLGKLLVNSDSATENPLSHQFY